MAPQWRGLFLLSPSSLSLLILLATGTSEGAQYWYISSSEGSTDISQCGVTRDNPCSSLQLILDNLTTIDGQGCYQGWEINIDQEVTFHLLGDTTLKPICLTGWNGLTITSDPSTTIDASLGPHRGIINILNSTGVTLHQLTFIVSLVGKATIHVSETSDLTIANCSFPVYATSCIGLLLKDLSDDIYLFNLNFHGNSILVDSFRLAPSSAIIIQQGYSGSYYTLFTSADTSLIPPFNLIMEHCTFTRLISTPRASSLSNDYTVASTSSLALLVQYGGSSYHNTLSIINCVFQQVTHIEGGVATVSYSEGTYNNSVSFEGCTFEDNKVRYGAGVSAFFLSNSHDNHMILSRCNFLRDKATFEGGGVFMASIVQNPSNELSINDCYFIECSALYGAGLFVLNDPNWFRSMLINTLVTPPLMNISMSNVTFTYCMASLGEGVVNLFNIHLTASGNNVFNHNNGSAILLRSSILLASGNYTFMNNKAQSGGALKVLYHSAIDFTGVQEAHFTFNQARFTGGAIYADASSTTVTADVYNHTLNIAATGACFMRLPPNGEKSLFYYSNNTALSSGNDFYIYNIRSCQQGYFLPAPLRDFLPDIFSNPVIIETHTPLLTTSTGPSYLYFYGSSSECYKEVGDVVYNSPNCSHELLRKSFFSLPQLICGVNALLREFSPYNGPGGGFHPTVDKLLLPWAGIGVDWTMGPSSSRQSCHEPSPGSLTLTPAPGQLFDLTIQLADQLLNFIDGTAYLQIDHTPDVPPGALLQLHGIQHSYTDRLYFTPNRALAGLAIVGLPGTTGLLNIVAESQIQGENIVLQIPFILSQCPLGYFNPPGVTNIEQVNKLILARYSTTQRIPLDQPLACHCFPNTNITYGTAAKLYTSSCLAGYTVELNGALWAGLIPLNGTLKRPETASCLHPGNLSMIVQDSLSAWIEAERKAQMEHLGTNRDSRTRPIDVLAFKGLVQVGGGAPIVCYTNYTIDELVMFDYEGEFSVDYCLRGFCEGSSLTQWYVSDVNSPCVENREGVLCGRCKPHLSQTMTSTICKDCSTPRWYIPLLTTLILGLLLVTVVILLNIGVTPTVDSLLFFIQGVYIIVSGRAGYHSFLILAIFNLDFTFDQCITSSLGALTRLLLQYATPLYIVLLLLIVLATTKIKGVSKYLGNHSILHAVWLLVLVSYLNIANSTFELVHCHHIGPTNRGPRQYVLVYDALVHCWEGAHLIWAIGAIVLAAFFIFPFSLYVWLATLSAKLKPLTDVYTSIYCDTQRNWVVWNLLRRILIVMLSVFVVNFIYRHFSLLVASLFILTVFVSTRPYRYAIDNLYGGVVSGALCLFCVVTQPMTYEYFDPQRIISWCIVSLVIFVGIILLVLEGILRYLKHKEHDYNKDDCMEYLKDKYFMFKDNLKSRLSKEAKYSMELSVSTANTPSSVYSQFREPLLDSESYNQSQNGAGTSYRKRKSRGGDEFETGGADSGGERDLPVAINNKNTSTVVSITNSLV